MPLDAELADLRDFLASRHAWLPDLARLLQVGYVRSGTVLPAGDDGLLVRSGEVKVHGGVALAASDALLVVVPATVCSELGDLPGLVRGRLPATPGAAPLRLLALDVETTGLIPGHDHVVSVGWVPVDGDRLDLAGARRYVVQGDDPGGAAEIHGLTADDLAAGTPLPVVLRELRAALAGRALLAHHATFDLRFLRAAFRGAGERMPRVPAVCTLTLQKRLLRADRLAEWPAGALRLWTARERYGLPAGRPHDALGDAVACAELYLGQAAEIGGPGGVTLRDVRMPTGWRSRLRRWWRRRVWRLRRRWRPHRDL